MITVLTATYNRADLLRRCFESLLMQDAEFEWLVIDDGSTDGTPEAVESWRTEAPFPVRLLSKPNGGKHSALNAALRAGLGKFTVLLDSDDALAPNALGRLTTMVNMAYGDLGGVIGNCHDHKSGVVIGSPIPSSLTWTTGRELREHWGVVGDTFRMYRSELLCRHPFPEFPGEKFVPENVVFDAIDDCARLLVTHDVMYLCDYQPRGLSAEIMHHRAQSPRGFATGLESTAWISRRVRLIVEYTLKYQVWCKVFLGTYGWSHFRRKGVYVICLPAAVLFKVGHRPAFIFAARELAVEPRGGMQPRTFGSGDGAGG